MDTKKRIKELKKLVAYHQKRYHEEDAPEISDEVYDSIVTELKQLSGTDEADATDVVNRIGGTPSEAFAKVTHAARQWSFDNVFTKEELHEWTQRVARGLELADSTLLSYVAEHKIDGLKIVLTYEAGKLVRAATRGNGVQGEDVTHTARTIKTIPHQLTEAVDLVCVGEVSLAEAELARINKERAKAEEPLFANPRNAAAGALRQLDPEVARSRNLSLYAYDIDVLTARQAKLVVPTTQAEELVLLKQLGLPVNPHYKLCRSEKDIQTFYDTWQKKRDSLPYGVDGVVLKVDRIDHQRALGYTAKSPRFGIAYKFKAVQATTLIEDIVLQVGRTGVVTPVAHLRPVLIDGSTVSRATLHNEDQIARLDVRIGDTIILQKAGDVIPEVMSVIQELRPKGAKPYRFPVRVEGCGGDGRIERIPGEAAYRCVIRDSDFLHRQRLYHFVGKQAMNFDGVGPRIIDALLEAGLINTASDLYTLTKDEFLTLEGFKERSAHNAVNSIEKSRAVPLERLLVALSIDNVGEETARVLAEHFGSLAAIEKANQKELADVYGVGEIVAESVNVWFANALHRDELKRLTPHLTILEPKAKRSSKLAGQTIVFTGTLTTLARDEAEALVRMHGGIAAGSVSKKTSLVVVGENAGSKADKARELGVSVVTEAEFLRNVRDT